jgi:hypothetical protein
MIIAGFGKKIILYICVCVGNEYGVYIRDWNIIYVCVYSPLSYIACGFLPLVFNA